MSWSYFKSRTFWTLVAIFVVNGGNAVIPVLPAWAQSLATAGLGMLAMYYHTNPSTTYNLPADGSSKLA